ncbi:Cystinosin-like protein, partial [Fragariocoptes setiger]
LTQAFLSINISRNTTLDVIILFLGWGYFAAWATSFYPQLVLNFQRKSVQGLSFLFLLLNLIGFASYSLYNIFLMYSHEVREEYYNRYSYSRIPVELNDVFFSVHASIITAITIGQYFVYYNREERTLYYQIGIVGCLVLLIEGVPCLLSLFNVITILDVLFVLSTVKLVITLVKYIPQAYLNYKRKSTEGWSVVNILLDLTGGLLSLAQMFFLAYNYNDWIAIFGNFTKFGLALASMGFDILFIVQHYVLYRNIPGEQEDLTAEPISSTYESVIEISENENINYRIEIFQGCKIKTFYIDLDDNEINQCFSKNHFQPHSKYIGYNPSHYSIVLTESIDEDKAVSIDVIIKKGDNFDDSIIQESASLTLDSTFPTSTQHKLITEKGNYSIILDVLTVRNTQFADGIINGIKRTLPEDWPYEKVLKIAHRGAGVGVTSNNGRRYIENTISSCGHAIAQGADFVELDLFVTRDGIPTVFHDFTVDIPSHDDEGTLHTRCVDSMKLEELRALNLIKMSNREGDLIEISIDELDKLSHPFPTLEEVLVKLPHFSGIFVELKYPQMLQNGFMEAERHHDVNNFVDKVLDVCLKYCEVKNIILSSFEPQVAILLRLKQSAFPVVFLTEGVTSQYEPYMDKRTRNLRTGIRFAQAFRMSGIGILADFYLEDSKLIERVHNCKMKALAWGDIINSYDVFGKLENSGIDGLIFDMDHVNITSREGDVTQSMSNGQ